ncbi:MAG: glycosyltransferase [Gemmatimonadetes bacterium]|nr:glycosyltransferase [Gemmatimonadota bacterium]
MSDVSLAPQRIEIPDSHRGDFAVVVPAFNEAPVIPDLIRELRETFRRHGLEGEVILVDDGSSDGTAELARKEAGDWPALRVVQHPRNFGKTEAMLTAARATDRSVLVVFDADLQHSTEEIPRLLSVIAQGWDIVCGRKIGAYDKQVVSSIYNRLSHRIFQVPVSDLNSIKAFRTEILRGIHLRHDWHRFFVVLAHSRGYSVTEMDVALFPRRAGVSKYSGGWRVVGGLVDLISVWFLLIFSRKPLLLFGTLGLAMIVLGFVVGLVAIYLRVFYQLGFRPLLTLVALLEIVGFTVFGFGLLAEMVALVREEVEEFRRHGPG